MTTRNTQGLHYLHHHSKHATLIAYNTHDSITCARFEANQRVMYMRTLLQLSKYIGIGGECTHVDGWNEMSGTRCVRNNAGTTNSRQEVDELARFCDVNVISALLLLRVLREKKSKILSIGYVITNNKQEKRKACGPIKSCES